MLQKLPLNHPAPDARQCIDILMGRAPATRVPLVEYIVDESVMKPIVTGMLQRPWTPWGSDRTAQQAYLDNFIQFWCRMGYDFVRFEQGYDFEIGQLLIADTAPGALKDRAWADEHHGAIRCWEDFERYPWPKPCEMDFSAIEYLAGHLPEGMGLITSHCGGPFEHLSRLMSLEGLCLAVYEAPDLVRAIAERIGALMVAFYRHILELDNVIAIFPGDDMGFRTQTLIPPDTLREVILPWHKRFASMTHTRKLPYFLHSCGNVGAIVEDLVAEVGIDGKHSFEDAILPVQDFQAKWGRRIAVLGGLDIDRLTQDSPAEVRRHTRFLVETCGPRGRYAIGSGNSIPSYIPVDNYLAMVDEALVCAAG